MREALERNLKKLENLLLIADTCGWEIYHYLTLSGRSSPSAVDSFDKVRRIMIDLLLRVIAIGIILLLLNVCKGFVAGIIIFVILVH